MKKIYFLVYQGGIANVFVADVKKKNQFVNHRRVMQSDFCACRNFCWGIKEAGSKVKVAWCNEAGDISQSRWHFSNFENAPFNENFAQDLIKNS